MVLEGGTRLQIRVQGDRYAGGIHTLAMLNAFSRPTTVSSALEALKAFAKNPLDMVELMGEVRRLYAAGILITKGQEIPALATGGFGSAPVHISMLNDRARTESYLKAIEKVVRPGDTVVEIGTGTGILAMAAARAGARRVYAIEANRIGYAARENFIANGYGDRIQIIEGWSTRVDLPEPADVLISEIIGNDPFGENVLFYTADARKRFLKPDARLIPERLRVFGIPVTISDGKLESNIFEPTGLGRWQEWYGFDFSPLERFSSNTSTRFFARAHSIRKWPMLSDPVLLSDIDFQRCGAELPHVKESVSILATGKWNGLFIYFTLDLGGGIRLSTHPNESGEDNSWSNPVWILPETRGVSPGDRFTISYKFGNQAHPDSISVEPA